MSPNTPRQQTLSETYQQAKAHHRQGRLNEAQALYLQVLQAAPGQPQVLHRLGVIAYQEEDLGEAVLLIQQAIGLNPSVAAFHNNLGNALKSRGTLKQAEASYREAVRLKPDYAMAQLNLARLQLQRGDAAEAEDLCRGLLQTAPGLGMAHCVLGEVLTTQDRPEEAVAAFERAVVAQPDMADAYTELGHLHRRRQDAEATVAAFRQAVRLQPEQVAGYQNLGSVYLVYNRLEEAERCFRQAYALAPDDPGVRYNLGTALRGLGKLPEARSHLEAVVQAQPEAIGAVYELNQLRSGVCDWTTRDRDLAQLVETTRRFLKEESEQRLPLLFLQRFDLPSDLWTNLVRQQAGVIERSVAPLKQPCVSVQSAGRPDRLKVGYVSPDFRAHAVGLLVHRMFALHDRSEFEVCGYTLTCPDHYSSDPYYRQIREGCDAFVDLSGMSVTAAAEKIAADGVHILIDLSGHTTFSRPELLALRPAPVQAHYLGFLDTMGADFLPYLIADETVVPDAVRDRYAEHVVYMPETFAVASPFEIDPAPVCRADCGLPEDGVVFCCFNHVYKIDPDVFDAWATILKAVPGSVLWLYNSGVEEAAVNLRREAQTRGIAANRLIFAPHVPIEQHLARCRLADLFLDTFVYNAGTTGVLALWAGVPVLSRPGKRFLNRMGASLAKAVGLPELICEDTDAYVAKAVHLATHPEELAALRNRLWQTRETQPLFQTERFVRHLETAYRRMWEQQVNGERADIRV
ncbi:MAG: tetratricopeptide repeat protein [bacterium]|nr:tetratricopeptide repeat protein [bacterium]